MLTWKSFFLSFFFLELDVILFFQPQSRCMFRSLWGENAVVKSMNATVVPTLKIGRACSWSVRWTLSSRKIDDLQLALAYSSLDCEILAGTTARLHLPRLRRCPSTPKDIAYSFQTVVISCSAHHGAALSNCCIVTFCVSSTNHYVVRRNTRPPHPAQPKAWRSKHTHTVARDGRHCPHFWSDLKELRSKPQQHTTRIERGHVRQLHKWQERERHTQRRGRRELGLELPQSSRQSGG